MRLAALLLMLPACTGNPCLSGGGEPTMVIGTGETAFEALPAELELIHGPQGGYHLVLAFEMMYMAGDELIAGTVTGSIGGVERASTSPWLDMSCADGALQAAGTNLIFADDFDPTEIADGPVTIAATFDDLDGNSVSAMAEVVVVDTVDENPDEETGDEQ